MNDLRILENLFEKHDDEIHFELFKRSNIVSINNENQGDYNKEIIFNTRSLASLLINYKDAYILLKIEVKIPYDGTDQGKKSVPKLISLKKSFELIEYLRISLNNVIITNESYVNRSSLVNYVLNNAYNDPTSCRNISKAISSGLNITDNQFITIYNIDEVKEAKPALSPNSLLKIHIIHLKMTMKIQLINSIILILKYQFF